MAERLTGTVLWFDDSKGYGFILAETGEKYFVHYSGVVGLQGRRTLNPNEKVSFDLGEDSQERVMAIDVLVEKMIPGGNRD